jgi:hypothetical protein
LVDIICDKMSEGGDNDGSSNANPGGGGGAGGSGGGSGPNVRGGPASGATKLTDSASNSSQSCQC